MSMRKPTLFENLLLGMAILAISIGYFFVHLVTITYGLSSFESTASLLLWFCVIFIVILVGVSENSKEEIKTIIKQQQEEINLLRQDLRRRR